MASTPTTRHNVTIGIRMVDPVPEDEARDTLGKNLGTGPDRFQAHPLLAARYPGAQAVLQPSDDLETVFGDPDLPPPDGLDLSNKHTPLSASHAGDSSLHDLHLKIGGRPLAPDIANQITRLLLRRYNPQFIEFHTEDERLINDAIALVQGGKDRKPLFHQYIKEIAASKAKKGKGKKGTENETTPALTSALNELANVLLRDRLKPKSGADGPPSFFRTGCTEAPPHNPELCFHPGHGEGQANPRPHSQWNDVRPDILVLKSALLGGGIDWGKIASLFEVKQDAQYDMRTEGKESFERCFPQLLKYLALLAHENPVTGRTCGVSACGKYLRLVMSDSLSCSTTRLCDMENPDHARDIVLMVAFLLGPLGDVIDTFHPPKDKFHIKNPDGDGSVEYEWVPMEDDPADASKKRKPVAQDSVSRKKAKGNPTDSGAASRDPVRPATTLTDSTNDLSSSSSLNTGKQGFISTKSLVPQWERTSDGDFFAAGERRSSLRSATQAGADRSKARDPAPPPWKILERRRDLWGRRTVAIAGMARRVNTEEPPESLVMKFVWSPPYVMEHELRMLLHIAEAIRRALRNEQGSSVAHRNLREALDLVESEVAARRPVALGMLADCNVKSRSLPPKFGIEDGFESNQSVSYVRLHLSAMCTRNLVGERIDETTPLTARQRGRVLMGTFGSLWLAACSDIHYRDINTGNILFWRDPEGVLHGFLIDYGNARELDKRRMCITFEELLEATAPGLDSDLTTNTVSTSSSAVEANSTSGKQGASDESGEATSTTTLSDGIQLRLDDARSANIYFISTSVHKMVEGHQLRNAELATLHELEDKLRKEPDSTAHKEDIADSRGQIEGHDKTLLALHVHRYIDDLESALYAHIFQMSSAAGEKKPRKPEDPVPALRSIQRFDILETKTKAWEEDLRQTLECINTEDRGWKRCMTSLVQRIRHTRQALNQQGVIQPQLTSLEHECFRDCLVILKSGIENMGDTAIRRIAGLRLPTAKSAKVSDKRTEESG